MRRRTTEAYIQVLRKIKTLSPRFNPSEIMTDFEAAEQRALASVFPSATLHGCLFHYAKVIIPGSRHTLQTVNVRSALYIILFVSLLTGNWWKGS